MSFRTVYSAQLASSAPGGSGSNDYYTSPPGKVTIITDLAATLFFPTAGGGGVSVSVAMGNTPVIWQPFPAGWQGNITWEGRIVLASEDMIAISWSCVSGDLFAGYVLSGYVLTAP